LTCSVVLKPAHQTALAHALALESRHRHVSVIAILDLTRKL
jgi:hypothetical protein